MKKTTLSLLLRAVSLLLMSSVSSFCMTPDATMDEIRYNIESRKIKDLTPEEKGKLWAYGGDHEDVPLIRRTLNKYFEDCQKKDWRLITFLIGSGHEGPHGGRKYGYGQNDLWYAIDAAPDHKPDALLDVFNPDHLRYFGTDLADVIYVDWPALVLEEDQYGKTRNIDLLCRMLKPGGRLIFPRGTPQDGINTYLGSNIYLARLLNIQPDYYYVSENGRYGVEANQTERYKAEVNRNATHYYKRFGFNKAKALINCELLCLTKRTYPLKEEAVFLKLKEKKNALSSPERESKHIKDLELPKRDIIVSSPKASLAPALLSPNGEELEDLRLSSLERLLYALYRSFLYALDHSETRTVEERNAPYFKLENEEIEAKNLKNNMKNLNANLQNLRGEYKDYWSQLRKSPYPTKDALHALLNGDRFPVTYELERTLTDNDTGFTSSHSIESIEEELKRLEGEIDRNQAKLEEYENERKKYDEKISRKKRENMIIFPALNNISYSDLKDFKISTQNLYNKVVSCLIGQNLGCNTQKEKELIEEQARVIMPKISKIGYDSLINMLHIWLQERENEWTFKGESRKNTH